MFEYKHLLPDPVFECNDLWYMRIDDTRSIQLKYVNGSPVLGFHDGWSAISVYTGLVSLYLLSLVRSQVVVTWIVSSDGRRLGDKLADLMADQLDLLREAVSSRGLAEPFGLVGDGMQLIGPLLLREILNLGTAADDDGAPDDIISSQDGLAMLGAPHGLHSVLRYDPGRPTLLLQEGWAVDDAGSCQGVGTISIVRAAYVPRMSRHLLTLSVRPMRAEFGNLDKTQSISILVNERLIAVLQLDPKWQHEGAEVAYWLPPELVGDRQFETVFRHTRDFTLEGLRLARADTPFGVELNAADLMMKFENIGDNCEFGLVQRHFEAEPVGLLRFAGLESPRRLIRFLDDRFGQFGTPGSLDLALIAGEYWIIDRTYNISYHTFRYQHEVAAEEVIRENEIKAGYLKRKFLEDLEDGEKILVYKRVVTQDLNEIIALHAALNGIGRVTKLFWVTEVDDRHAPGDVEWVGDRLLKGYLGSISLTNAHQFDPDIWLRLCRSALAVFATAERRVKD